MKKLAIIAILAAFAGAASAADIGLRGTHSEGTETNSAGIVIGQKFGALGAEAAFDRSTVGTNNVNRFSLLGTYDVVKLVGVTLTAKAGGAFVDPTVGVNGYAALVGVGASYPVTKSVSLVADYAYQKDQSRIRAFDGNTFSVGAKYSF